MVPNLVGAYTVPFATWGRNPALSSCVMSSGSNRHCSRPFVASMAYSASPQTYIVPLWSRPGYQYDWPPRVNVHWTVPSSASSAAIPPPPSTQTYTRLPSVATGTPVNSPGTLLHSSDPSLRSIAYTSPDPPSPTNTALSV